MEKEVSLVVLVLLFFVAILLTCVCVPPLGFGGWGGGGGLACKALPSFVFNLWEVGELANASLHKCGRCLANKKKYIYIYMIHIHALIHTCMYASLLQPPKNTKNKEKKKQGKH